MAIDTDYPLKGQGYEEACALAGKALSLAERHRVPPVPKAFEVWFTYAGGLHSTITTRIDRALDMPEAVEPAFIHKLYDEFLSPGAIGDGVARIGDRMDNDLAEVIDLIEDSISASDAFGGKIRRIDQALVPGLGAPEIRANLAALRDATRAHAGRIAQFSDNVTAVRAQFTAMQKELRELRQSVLIDHETQLPNRRRFDEVLDGAIARARRARRPLSVLMADIDHLQAFNDRWGRATGDLLLLRFAELLRQSLRDGDMPARIGGDEFALILPGTTLDTARDVADELRQRLASLKLVRSGSRERVASMTASLGVTMLAEGDTGKRILARLEDFTFRAKEAGRNQVWSAG